MKNYYCRGAILAFLLAPFFTFSQYCTPTFSQGCAGGDFIDGVSIGTISNTTSGCSNQAYGDFTAMQASVNQSLQYNVTIDNTPQYGEGFGIWVDWNQDLDFADAGEFFTNGVVTPSGGQDVITITVPAGATLGTTRMRVLARWNTAITVGDSCGGSYGEAEDYTLDVQPAPPCSPPTALTASGVTFDQATLNWTAAGGATDYNIEYGPVGFTPGAGQQSGTMSAIAGTTATLTGLTPQTDYDIYVQTNCGGALSPWAGPENIETACAPITAPWVENFTVTSTPACWSQSKTTGGPWVFTGNPGWDASGTLDHTNNSPNNYAWIDFSGSDAGVILQTPIIDVSALTSPELRFWLWSYASQNLNPFNELHVEAWDGTAWQLLTLVQGNFGPDWMEFNAVIPPAMFASATTVQLRFRAESGGASVDYYNDLLLDDVSITEAPTCPKPKDFAITASNSSSVTLSWTEVGSATEWKFEYGPQGFTQGSGTTVLVNTNPADITGLAPNQFYDVYLQSACSPGDTSVAVGPLTFNTYNQGLYMEAGASCGPGFIDISMTGTNMMLTDDSEAGLPLQFPWLVLGQPVSEITVGNNGGILINTQSGNVSYTMNSGDGFYPFVLDLDHDVNGVDLGGVFWEVIGQAPNRQYVFMWLNRPRWNGNTNTNPCTFEMIYDEATNEVYYTYPDTDFGNPNYDFGADAEIGFRGTQDVTVSINSPAYLQENECVHLYYTNCPKPSDMLTNYITTDEASFSWTAGLSNETDWLVIYGPAGFDPATGGTPLTTTSPTIVLGNLDQLTEYDVHVYALCANMDTSFSISNTFKTLPLCSDPTNVGADTQIDSLIASWSWSASDPMYNHSSYNTSYGSPGFDPIMGTIFAGDTLYDGDTIPDVSFLAGGVYEMYVQAVCDTLNSNWVGPVTFVMPLTNDSTCGAETLPVNDQAFGFSNDGATIQPGELGIAPPPTGPQTTDGWANDNLDFTTWFKFIAPATGEMRISGLEADFDGQVAVYEVGDCGDFGTFNLVAANDDQIDGDSPAPDFTICGLTPGNEYYLMHDSRSSFSTGVYSLRLSEIDLQAGTSVGVTNVCIGDTISLFDGLTGNDAGGTWVDLENTFKVIDNEFFASTGLASDQYTFEYRLEDGCAVDSISTTFEVYAKSSAGTDGALSICLNEPFDALAYLGGTIQTGGQWYDASGNPIASSYVLHGTLGIPGAYIYRYIVGNGVCPDDSSIVTVTVNNSCDWLGLGDLNAEGFKLYPNPTTDQITVSATAAGEFEMEVLDMSGRVVRRISAVDLGTPYTLQVDEFESGVYFVNLKQGDRSTKLRFVKQ